MEEEVKNNEVEQEKKGNGLWVELERIDVKETKLNPRKEGNKVYDVSLYTKETGKIHRLFELSENQIQNHGGKVAIPVYEGETTWQKRALEDGKIVVKESFKLTGEQIKAAAEATISERAAYRDEHKAEKAAEAPAPEQGKDDKIWVRFEKGDVKDVTINEKPRKEVRLYIKGEDGKGAMYTKLFNGVGEDKFDKGKVRVPVYKGESTWKRSMTNPETGDRQTVEVKLTGEQVKAAAKEMYAERKEYRAEKKASLNEKVASGEAKVAEQQSKAEPEKAKNGQEL